ncbi:hypothetical protein VY86_15370 [Photorhabdus thracensis]|uniref:Uncharacterized protein n=1 Tax=Photorhabdus thracensis TaxID=230089 RepID=A0A0F7LS06_9GAMM|nr:hypothetical protein VY86_15370 [Photorhabdus thracensis]
MTNHTFLAEACQYPFELLCEVPDTVIHDLLNALLEGRNHLHSSGDLVNHKGVLYLIFVVACEKQIKK